MPYLHVNLPGKYPAETKRELAVELCRAYAEIMETQFWRPNVGIAELGEDNLFHLSEDGLEKIIMVMIEYRKGRPTEYRLNLARRIASTCSNLCNVPLKNVQIEFSPHEGNEIYRNGDWVSEWSSNEAKEK